MMIKSLVQRTVFPHLRKVIIVVTEIACERRKDEERVHALRTETRRAMVGLHLYADWLPCRRAKWIERRLVELCKRAGTVRDLDILVPLISIDPAIEQVRPWLMKQIASQRAKKIRSLKRHCRRLLGRDFEKRVRSLENRIYWRPLSAEVSLTEFCTNSIEAMTSQFFLAADALKTDVEHLHEVRIHGRRLRYALDLLREGCPEVCQQEVRRLLSNIQNLLGQAHDRDFALRFLRTMSWERILDNGSIEPMFQELEITTADRVKSMVEDSMDQIERLRRLMTGLACMSLHEPWRHDG